MHETQLKLLRFMDERGGIIKGLTLREIGAAIEVDHPQKIDFHLRQLRKKNFIIINSNTKEYQRCQDSDKNILVSIPIVRWDRIKEYCEAISETK